MPSKSKKQRRFMAAAANNPKFAKKVGIKSSVAKEFHNADKRKKYAMGGLAASIGPMLQRRAKPGRAMHGDPRAMPPSHPAMRRPPPQGGLSQAIKPMPSRIAPPPGKRLPDPRAMPPIKSTGLQMPPAQPVSRRMPPSRGIPGNRPQMGGLSAYAGAGGSSGPIRRPQQPAGGRSRFMGRIPGAQPGNGLLRTAGNPSQNYGSRLQSLMGRRGPMRFAKGGSIKKAVDALREARDWLIHSSDEPEFNMARAELDKIPGAEGLKKRIEEIQATWESTNLSADEAAGFGREMDTEFERFRSAMDPDSPSFQEQDLTFMDEFNGPGRKPENERAGLLANAQDEIDQLRGGATRPIQDKIRGMLEDFTEGNVDGMKVLTQDPEAGFYQVEVKNLEGNSEIFEIDFKNPEMPITFLE